MSQLELIERFFFQLLNEQFRTYQVNFWINHTNVLGAHVAKLPGNLELIIVELQKCQVKQLEWLVIVLDVWCD